MATNDITKNGEYAPALTDWANEPDLRDLNYSKDVEQGEEKISRMEDYNSHNTERLDVDGMQRLLLKLSFMQAIQRGEHVTPEE